MNEILDKVLNSDFVDASISLLGDILYSITEGLKVEVYEMIPKLEEQHMFFIAVVITFIISTMIFRVTVGKFIGIILKVGVMGMIVAVMLGLL